MWWPKCKISSALQGGKERLSPSTDLTSNLWSCITYFLCNASLAIRTDVLGQIKSPSSPKSFLWQQSVTNTLVNRCGQKSKSGIWTAMKFEIKILSQVRRQIPKTGPVKSLPPSQTLSLIVLNSVCASECEWNGPGSEETNSTAWTPCFIINIGFK